MGKHVLSTNLVPKRVIHQGAGVHLSDVLHTTQFLQITRHTDKAVEAAATTGSWVFVASDNLRQQQKNKQQQ